MMFWVISGVVLGVSLSYGPQKAGTAIGRFVIARAFRIYPIVFISTLVVALTAAALPVPGVPSPIDPMTFIRNAVLLEVGMNGVLWALQVEILAIPVILGCYFAVRKLGLRYVALAGLFATALSFTGSWAIWPPFSRNIFAFVLGILIPTIGRDLTGRMSNRWAQLSALAAILGLLLAGPLLGFYSQWGAVIEAYSAAALISLLVYYKGFHWAAFLDSGITRLLGRVSGSIYVLHVPITGAIGALLASNGVATSQPWFVPITLLLVFLISIVTFSLIEAPGIALGRNLIRRLRLGS